MGDKTPIESTDATWNPVTGCTKIARGCDNCYAARFTERFRGTPGHPFEKGFDVTLRPERLSQPLSWRRPRRIFVNWRFRFLCGRRVIQEPCRVRRDGSRWRAGAKSSPLIWWPFILVGTAITATSGPGSPIVTPGTGASGSRRRASSRPRSAMAAKRPAATSSASSDQPGSGMRGHPRRRPSTLTVLNPASCRSQERSGRALPLCHRCPSGSAAQPPRGSRAAPRRRKVQLPA